MLDALAARIDGWDPSRLAGDEVFVSALAEASRIAMGTHLEEKLLLLKNCLTHMAVDESRDGFLDLELFRFVDELAPEHFLLLQYLSSPSAWFDAKAIPRPNISMGAPKALLPHAELPVAGMALELVLRTLNDRGLADTGSLGTMMTSEGMWQASTTDLGRELLSFVSEV